MRSFRRDIVDFYHDAFNVKFTLVSACFNGSLTVWVNWSHGPEVYRAAGLTQCIASFLMTGFTARLVQHFSPLKNPLLSYAGGILVPSLFTFCISLVAHIVNGTPQPFLNAIPATLVSLSTCPFTNFFTRLKPKSRLLRWLVNWFRPRNYRE